MFRTKIILGIFAAAFALLSFFVKPPDTKALTVDPSTRTVENSLIKISWDQIVAERVDGFYYKPFDPEHELSGAHYSEFFGRATALALEGSGWIWILFSLVVPGNTDNSWQYSIDGSTARVEIHSNTPDSQTSFNPYSIPVTTVYEIKDGSSVIKVERTFGFGSPGFYPSRLIPYQVRGYTRNDFTRMAWEKTDGTVGTIGITCEFGCEASDWKQTWFDLEAPAWNYNMGIGMINLEGNPPSRPRIDRDGSSETTYISTSIENEGYSGDLTVSYLIVPHLGDYSTVNWEEIASQYNDDPTPPAPFLDLPWDYESKGKTFSEAATAINAFFDHEYPLLSAPSLMEPLAKQNQVTTYEGERSTTKSYSSHDGYDYGTRAGATLGEAVLAAADGCASYTKTSLGGNSIRIDHGNAYQTRYLHLLADGLITTSQTCVNVIQGQQIGKVGYTGHVEPEGALGSHIHFMVVHDKNGDGNFDDNIPDGLVDPFGWQTAEVDPWQSFSFFYNGLQRTGATSYYLWLNPIANFSQELPANGGFFALERYSLDFPEGSTDQTLNINLKISPIVRISNFLESIGSSIIITAKDLLGNVVTGFLNFFTISIKFEGFDLTSYDLDSLSIYSSEDGVNWTKEETTIDFDNQVASASVNHLSYFALMAERLDTLPPNTIARLDGKTGTPGWYRSDVVLTLNSTDNDGGLGVDYTLFRVNDEDWQLYTSPFSFSQNGSYGIEYYSVDKDENIEEIKIIKFGINKVAPETKVKPKL